MLAEQNYLIANVASDLGCGIALTELAEHATFFLNYSDDVATEFQSTFQRHCSESKLKIFPLDIKNENDVEQLFAEINGAPLSGVLYCLPDANQQTKSILDISLAEWNHTLEKTLHTLFYVARRSIEEFVTEGRPGRFIICQMDHSLGKDTSVFQTTLETALLAFSRSIAKEYGRRHITCNTVIARREKSLQALINFIFFLFSKQSAYLTGELIDLR